MSNLSLSYIDIWIVIFYLIICLVVGLRKFDKIKTIRDYTLGIKPFSTIILIATTFATVVSAGRAVGLVEKTYSLGLVFIAPIIFSPICWVIMSRILSAKLDLFKKQKFLTLSDIMEYWYGKPGRWVVNVCSIFYALGVAAVSITAIGYLFHYFLGIPEVYGALLGVVVITIYSAFGGIQAVAFTDLFQFLIFVIALPFACAVGLNKVGGIENVFTLLPKTHLTIGSSNIMLFLSLCFYSIFPYTSTPYIQRVLMAKDKAQLIKAFNITGMLLLPFFLIISLIGLIAYVDNPTIDPNTALYRFISNTLSPGALGFVVAGLLAVIMSTQDSFLNATSSLIARDICKQIWPKLTDKNQLMIARVSCVAITGLAMAISFAKNSIIEIIWLIDNFWDPIITMPLFAGILGIKIHKKSFIALVVACVITLLITRLTMGEFDTRSFSISIAVSIAVLYIANKRYKKQHPSFKLDISRNNQSLLIKVKKAISNYRSFNLGSVYIFSSITLASYLTSLFLLPVSYDAIIYFRITAAILCLFLLLNELLDNRLRRKFLTYFWYFSLCFCLPFVASYLIFSSKYDFMWIANFILSIALLYLLTNAVISILLTSVGVGISYWSFFTINNLSAEYLYSNNFAIFSCAFITIAIVIHIYKQKYIDKEIYEQVTSVLEDRVAERTTELKEALEVKEEFLSKLSHEVRTPLQGIIGISTELDRDWDRYSPEDRKKYIHMIATSGDRLMSYTKNILDFASYNKNAIKLNLEQDVDLVEIAKDVIQDSESLIISLNKPLEVVLELSQFKTAQIECDRMKVTEIFYNLVNNAIKYSKAGKIVVKIENEKHDVKISVIDQGVGVPEDEKHAIFEPFTESTRTKTRAGGTGLGLSIVREIIYLHQGTVKVENNQPQGSKFIVTLPIQQDKGPRSFGKRISPAKGKILIVDDESTCLNALSMILLSLGYEPYTAQGGVQALEYLKNNYQNIDIVLLDLMMPDMNGVEVLKQVKNDPQLGRIPVIIQSGYTSANNDDIRKAESELGASKKSIEKPYNRDDVEAAIALVLHKKPEKATKHSTRKIANKPARTIKTKEVMA